MLKRRHDAGDVTMADPGSYQNGDPPRHPWENVEDIVQILKTTSPLLIMSMETVIDQINHRFKPTPEEDVYRHIWMLLTDACQVFPQVPSHNGQELMFYTDYANEDGGS